MCKIEKVFALLSIVFGLFFVFLTPPFQSVDENFHFLRAYGISNYDFIAQKRGTDVGSYMPASLARFIGQYSYLIKNIGGKTSFHEIIQSGNLALENSNQTFLVYPNTALYSPVAYSAQALGIMFAKILNMPPLVILYVARIFNLILYTILGFYAIKTVPIFKQVAFLILLMPMNLSLGASVSSDATLISASVLYFAFLLNIYYKKKDVDLKTCVILTLFSLVFAVTKQYLFMSFFILLLPIARNKKFIILFLSCFCALGWSYVVKNLYVCLADFSDPVLQLQFILSNPFKYLFILLYTSVVNACRLIFTAVGVLGWQDTRLDIITYMTYPLLIILSSFNKEKILSRCDAVKMFIITLLSYCIIVTLIYWSWTAPRSLIVFGLNGKYFIPILLPFLLSINTFVKCNFQIKNVYLYGYLALVLTSAVVSILIRFYNIFPNLYYQI